MHLFNGVCLRINVTNTIVYTTTNAWRLTKLIYFLNSLILKASAETYLERYEIFKMEFFVKIPTLSAKSY